jgi:non-ribosomal peptide synthetase component F
MASTVDPQTTTTKVAQKEAEQKKDRGAAATAWRQALAGLEQPTRLLLAPVSVAGAESITADCSVEGKRFATLAAQQGISAKIVVQAAWSILLGRLTGLNDVVFGISVSSDGKSRTVPRRAMIHPGESVLDLMRRLEAQHSELSPHDHLPLSDIEQLTGLDQLFDTRIEFANGAQESEATQMSDEAPHCVLTVVVHAAEQLRLQFVSTENYFDRESLETIAARLGRLLEAVLENPLRRVW